MQNRTLIAKAAARAACMDVAPSARQLRALRNEMRLAKGYPEYNPDQARDSRGRFASGGGGGGGGGAGSKEPSTPRDWSTVVSVASDVALIAATIALTGPAGAASMVSAVTGSSIANLARTSIGRTAMTAASGIAATKVWGTVAEPLFRHIGKLYGAVGLATAFESFKRMGGRVPSGTTWRKLANRFGIPASKQQLARAGQQIKDAVRQAVQAAKRTLQGSMRMAAV